MSRADRKRELSRGLSSVAGGGQYRDPRDIEPVPPVASDALDGLARAIAAPMPRRRAVKLGGAVLAGLFLGRGLSPSPARAEHCIGIHDKHCPQLSGDRPFCCPEDTVCCTNGVTNACCSAGGMCVDGRCQYEEDPCGPGRYICKGSGCCPDENNCCSGTCCIDGYVCVKKKCSRRCPRGRVKCGTPPRCCPRGYRCGRGKCRRRRTRRSNTTVA